MVRSGEAKPRAAPAYSTRTIAAGGELCGADEAGFEKKSCPSVMSISSSPAAASAMMIFVPRSNSAPPFDGGCGKGGHFAFPRGSDEMPARALHSSSISTFIHYGKKKYSRWGQKKLGGVAQWIRFICTPLQKPLRPAQPTALSTSSNVAAAPTSPPASMNFLNFMPRVVLPIKAAPVSIPAETAATA